jgi:hypothetical protein
MLLFLDPNLIGPLVLNNYCSYHTQHKPTKLLPNANKNPTQTPTVVPTQPTSKQGGNGDGLVTRFCYLMTNYGITTAGLLKEISTRYTRNGYDYVVDI